MPYGHSPLPYIWSLPNIIIANLRLFLQDENCNLKEGFGFDSLLMVELVIEIEEQFGFEFDAEEMDMKKLQSYQNLLDLVRKHKSEVR